MKGFPVLLALAFVAACSEDPSGPQLSPISQPSFSISAPALCGATTAAFMAGQTTNAGTVSVGNDDTNLYVTITTTGGWTLRETHIAAAKTVAGIPHNKPGNPVPGQFPVKATNAAGTTTYTATFSLASLGVTTGQNVVVAAHADVANGSSSEGAWSAGTRFVQSTWATYSAHTIASCGYKALILSNSPYEHSYIAGLVGPLMPNVTFESASSAATLTPAYLAQFKVVLLYENGLWYEAASVGDKLAAYINSGGNVVLGTFYWQDRSDNVWYGSFNYTWGQLETLDPLHGDGQAFEYRYAQMNPASVVAHPLTAGVNSFTSAYYPNGMVAKPGTIVVASYFDGAPFIAYVPHGLGQLVVAVAA